MKHITSKGLWGKEQIECHTLKLTNEERDELKPFLDSLGIELRPCSMWCENGVWVGEYQARNPFKNELHYVDADRYEMVKKDIEKGWWRR